MFTKKNDEIVSKDAHCLYTEFLNSKEIYQKYMAYEGMKIFHDLFSSNSKIEEYYQIMSIHLARNDVLVQEAKKKREHVFDLYLSEKFSFLENNLPGLPFSINTDGYQFLPLNKYNMDFLLDSFFWRISHNLYRFYKHCSNTGKVLMRAPYCEKTLAGFSKGEKNGLAFSSSVKREKSYVYLNVFDTLEGLALLVHEIGHAYFFSNVRYHFKDMMLPEKEIRLEIPSRTLEYLFILYLKELNIPEAKMLEDKFYSRAFVERWDNDLFTRYQYTLGNIFAITCGYRINREISFEKYCKAIYYADFEKMVIGTCNRFRNQTDALGKQRKLSN